jgi:glycosyltransferase involved in cell wall biosynthesis
MGAAMAEHLAPLNVQHIHAHHGYFASWMAAVAARLLGVSFSFTLHGSDLLVRADLLAAKLRQCQFCVTVSEFNRQYILDNFPGTPASKIIVQRLGVDQICINSNLRARLNPRGVCLLSVGRLHAVKNHAFLVKACAALREEGLEFVCLIAGEGPERKALQLLIDSLHLEDRALLVGHVDRAELSNCYQDADVVALTSISEGIPVALMEAMAHRKLVIAPAITGIPELVKHGTNGFLYKPGSLPDFVSRVQWILNHKTSLGAVERAAAESIAVNYDRQQNLRQFADHLLSRIAPRESSYASALLQQVQLSI